ncbi:FtsH protease activity modulator HflK [bacterium]
MDDNDIVDVDFPEEPKFPFKDIRVVKFIVLGLISLVMLLTMFFTVRPEEVGVVLRFGKYTRTVTPGLNIKIPFGIENVSKVPVERQLKMEFGFRSIKPGVRTQYAKGGFEDESLMLTGDLNAAEVEWIVQYRISDPYKFLFKVRNPIKTFRDMNEAIMRQIVGDRTINEVLTVGRQEISTAVSVRLQELCDQYEIGIKVDQIVLQDVNPPDKVKASFNEVNEAQQEREKLINQAQSEYNKIIPRAKGEAQKKIEEAKGYAIERINRAKGEISKFNALLGEYARAKEVTRQRIYLETMGKVLPKLGRKILIDENTKGILPLLNLDYKEGKK